MAFDVHLISVFGSGGQGGNPAPVVVDAAALSDDDMRGVAADYGHESGFVAPAPAGSDCDFTLRFWVPRHEMEMCGHVTVGTVWLLDRLGLLPRDHLVISTLSGRVQARVAARGAGGAEVEITQPAGVVESLSRAAAAQVLSVLGIGPGDLAEPPLRNAATSRVKTLVPLKSVEALDALSPDFARMEAVCEAIGSTGLYPYAVSDGAAQVFEARQFPRSSGYPEDAATGVAAAALAFGLLESGLVAPDDRTITVRQGRAMGRPSSITVRFRLDAAGAVEGCWLGGAVRLEDAAAPPRPMI